MKEKIKSILTNAKISRKFAKEEWERKKKYLKSLTIPQSAKIVEELVAGSLTCEILRAKDEIEKRFKKNR
ncbi:MAG: hypothetical protein J7L54_05830 [Elusimicrobia bacterium]|nr:hypothetical protein [Elusimicrobiota bacterium]